MAKAFRKFTEAITAIAKVSQPHKVVKAATTVVASILGPKLTGVEIKATTGSKTVNKVLETAAAHPFATAGIATGVVGATKAVGLAAIKAAATSATTNVIKSPTTAKVLTTGTAAVILNPSLITGGNLKYAGAIALSPVGAGVGFLTEQAEKTSSYVKSETKKISSKISTGGFSSLSTKEKAEVIGAPIAGALAVGGAALAAKTALNSITGGGLSSTKEKTNKVIQDTKQIVQDLPKGPDLPKTPTNEQPKIVDAAAISDIGTTGTTEISPFKQNATVTPQIVKRSKKHRKINKQVSPRVQSQRQNIINQVYVGG